MFSKSPHSITNHFCQIQHHLQETIPSGWKKFLHRIEENLSMSTQDIVYDNAPHKGLVYFVWGATVPIPPTRSSCNAMGLVDFVPHFNFWAWFLHIESTFPNFLTTFISWMRITLPGRLFLTVNTARFWMMKIHMPYSHVDFSNDSVSVYGLVSLVVIWLPPYGLPYRLMDSWYLIFPLEVLLELFEDCHCH